MRAHLRARFESGKFLCKESADFLSRSRSAFDQRSDCSLVLRY